MTEKELIRESMSQNLKLPTDMTAEEAAAGKKEKAAVRISFFNSLAVAFALALAVGVAGFAFLQISKKPEVSSNGPWANTKQGDEDTDGFGEQVNNLLDSLSDHSELYYATYRSYNKSGSIETNYELSESMNGYGSEVAQPMAEYLAKVTNIEPESNDDNITVLFENSQNKILTIKSTSEQQSLSYTETGDKSYIRIITDSDQQCYSFDAPTGESAFFSEYGRLLPLKWEMDTSTSTCTKGLNASGIIISDARNNISFSCSIDSIYDTPNITVKYLGAASNAEITSDIKVTVTPMFGPQKQPGSDWSVSFNTYIAAGNILMNNLNEERDDLTGLSICIEFDVSDDITANGKCRLIAYCYNQ